MFQLINEKEMTETLTHNKSVDLGISISADIRKRANQTFSLSSVEIIHHDLYSLVKRLNLSLLKPLDPCIISR